MPCAGTYLAPDQAAADHDRIRERRERGLRLAVCKAQPALELPECKRALSADPPVAQAELVQTPHPRRSPRHIGRVLEPARLPGERYAREWIGRVRLVAELRVVDGEAS